jgi:hypothetical protein
VSTAHKQQSEATIRNAPGKMYTINIYVTLFKTLIIMESYDTVTGALAGLKAKGYTMDFNIAFDKIICRENNFCLNPHEFEITEVYRFEGDTNPADEDVIYAVESRDGTMKGVITSAYGMYADGISTEMVKKLAMHR